VVEDGVRIFGSKLLDSNALSQSPGEDFVVGLNNISLYSLGLFMKFVVARLGIVAGKVMAYFVSEFACALNIHLSILIIILMLITRRTTRIKQ
jgi:hypothetical protein